MKTATFLSAKRKVNETSVHKGVFKDNWLFALQDNFGNSFAGEMMMAFVRLARSQYVYCSRCPASGAFTCMWMTRPASRTLILLVASRYPFGQFVFV